MKSISSRYLPLIVLLLFITNYAYAQLPQPTPITKASPVLETLNLSKNTAYLSGDTIVVTVVDDDRNKDTNNIDILTTSLKVTGANYSVGTVLYLDLKETGVYTGMFLATIRTGTVTQGGADQNNTTHPDNNGTIKAVQGGIANVIYIYKTPFKNSVTKQVTFSSYDATIAFSADSYELGQYAVITMADAEQNNNNETAQTLLDSVFVKTSPSNVAKVRMVENGADTGTFVGSILVASSGVTTDLQNIVAASGDMLTTTYTDEVNTTGSTRLVTDTASVVAAAPTPTPEGTPTATECPTCDIFINAFAVTGNATNITFNFATLNGEFGCSCGGVTSATMNSYFTYWTVNSPDFYTEYEETLTDGSDNEVSIDAYNLKPATTYFYYLNTDLLDYENDCNCHVEEHNYSASGGIEVFTTAPLLSDKGNIAGSVYFCDGLNGCVGIAYATVRLIGKNTKTFIKTISDGRGYFASNYLDPDDYTIIVTKKDYKRTKEKVKLEAGENEYTGIILKKL